MDADLKLIGLLDSDKSRVLPNGIISLEDYISPELMEGLRRSNKSPFPHIRDRLQNPNNPLTRFKPIYMHYDEGTTDESLNIVLDALTTVLKEVKMDGILPIIALSNADGKKEGPDSFESIIMESYNTDRYREDIDGKGQCDISKIRYLLSSNQIIRRQPGYDIVVISDFDLYDSGDIHIFGLTQRYITGIGIPDQTFIGLRRLRGYDPESIKELALHEFGHTFAGYSHCSRLPDKLDYCVMKIPNDIPADFIRQANQRAQSGRLFCTKHQDSKYQLPWSGFNLEWHDLHPEHFPEVEIIYQMVINRDPVILGLVESGALARLETHLTTS
ncbi:MAG: hypothetical protein ABII01_07715 [Candidatus Woesearchaeota archaeon]